MKAHDCSGNEIGPFRAVEESTVAHLTPQEQLSDIYVWYSLIGTAGSAVGIMVCGWFISFLRDSEGWEFVRACQAVFLLYAGVGAAKLMFTVMMSGKVEADEKVNTPSTQQQDQESDRENEPLLRSPGNHQEARETRQSQNSLFAGIDRSLFSMIVQLFILFGLDSFASGLASL